MFVVRSATYADVADVDALLRRAYPRLLRGDYDDKTLEQALPFISRAQPDLVTCGTYYVVHEDGALLGAGGWTRHAPGTGVDTGDIASDIGHVRHVVTDDRATRRGVARHLMSHVFAAAQVQGITQLHCLSTLTAVPFYQAVGFTGGEGITVPLSPSFGFPAVEMKRWL